MKRAPARLPRLDAAMNSPRMHETRRFWRILIICPARRPWEENTQGKAGAACAGSFLTSTAARRRRAGPNGTPSRRRLRGEVASSSVTSAISVPSSPLPPPEKLPHALRARFWHSPATPRSSNGSPLTENRMPSVLFMATAEANRVLAYDDRRDPARSSRHDRLFGEDSNHRVFRNVRRCCVGLRHSPVQALMESRGTHAKVARRSACHESFAHAMGHESETTTAGHYAKPRAAVANAAIERTMDRSEPRPAKKSSAGVPSVRKRMASPA